MLLLYKYTAHHGLGANITWTGERKHLDGCTWLVIDDGKSSRHAASLQRQHKVRGIDGAELLHQVR